MAPGHPLRWSTQLNNYIPASDLPPNTTRHFVQTSHGQLEVLVAEPPGIQPRRRQALFFQHGAFGYASTWLPYTTYLSQLGYPCYAISVRGHGASWVPGIAELWCTTKATLARDMVTGIEWAKAEEMRKRGSDTASIVLVGHSMGGGLVQYALSKELIKVTGLILCGPAPGSGMIRVFMNFLRADPFFIPRFLLHGLHPRTMVPTTTHVRRLFFSPQCPNDKLEDFAQYLAESESILWVLGLLPKFVNFQTVVQRSVVGLTSGKPNGERILILVGELDVLMGVRMMHRLADRYRNAVRHSIGGKKEGPEVEREASSDEGYVEDRQDGVRMTVVNGAGHHVQNDLQWEVGAQRVADFLQQL